MSSIREAIIQAARCHANNMPNNVTAYLAVFRLEQGRLVELLAYGQAHVNGNHVQFHSTHLRFTDLEWDTLDIVRIHPILFKRMNMNKEAGDNVGINN